MKYATAISPQRMKATGRVNNPTVMKSPPETSNNPAAPRREKRGMAPIGGGAGNPKSFWVP